MHFRNVLSLELLFILCRGATSHAKIVGLRSDSKFDDYTQNCSEKQSKSKNQPERELNSKICIFYIIYASARCLTNE
jgi:hypothetical protein